jgi:nitroreductase
MEIARNRITTRQFDPEYEMPQEHYEMVLEAARHSPSGANAQPWHYIVVRDPAVKQEIADYFVEEQRFRASLKMKFPTPNYSGLATAPGFIVVVADFRYVKAFPMGYCCKALRHPRCRHTWRRLRSAITSGG